MRPAEKKIIIFFRGGLRTLSPLLLVLSAGCPETLGQQCPPNTVPIGEYSLSFAGQHPAGECRQVIGDDGGPADASLTFDDGGSKQGALCTAPSGDGGTILYLAIPGKGQRPATYFIDGGFQFVGHTDPTPGTACSCAVGIDETFNGALTGSWDGSFPILADGGLPLVTGLKGTLIDTLTTDSGQPCLCNLPCAVTYSVSGSRF